MRVIFSSAWSFLFLVLTVVPAGADSVRVLSAPRPVAARFGTNFELEKVSLEAVVDGQKARCTLTYVIYNPGSSPIEVDFIAPLPSDGAVTGLNLFDGKNEMPGQVYDKDEAFKVYRQIVDSLRDPALLEYAGRGAFRARVFPVPAKGRQTLELNFDYLAPKDEGQVSFSFPLAGPLTKGRRPEQDIQVVIKDAPNLSGIYSPLADVAVKREPGQDAVAKYEKKGEEVIDDFRLYFSLNKADLGALVLSHKPEKDEDGFFLFFAEPGTAADKEIQVAKNVIFVLDKSGSMSGPKFKQATGALKFILERLADIDNFNLVDYNSGVAAWKPEIMNMSPENRRAALGYVENLRSGGGTNIEEALTTSLAMIGDPQSPNYIVFLTDGQPTVGEQNEMKLAEIAKKADPQGSARLFAFGVGHDVNARLLDRLSGQAGGTSVFVAPQEDLEAKVSSFFAKISSPALTKPAVTSELAINRVLPETLPDLFSGQQLVVVGRYPKGGETGFTISGRQGDKEIKQTFKAVLADGPSVDGRFIAGLWAQRRIGELLDQIDLGSGGGKPNKELVDELVALSKRYGILTPYTSFLALEEQKLTENSELTRMAEDNLSIMQEEVVGASANEQRAFKGQMKDAPAAAGPSKSYSRDQAQAAAKVASFDKRVSRAVNRDLSLPNQWAGRTFFYKNSQWQADDLTEDDLKNPVRISQFSDDYYELAGKLAADEMVWLAQTEPVIFNFAGKTYLIEPAQVQ